MKNRKIFTDKYMLNADITQEADGSFIAVCPEWDDCYAQGDTLQQALIELNYVAAGLIELYAEEGMTIPLELISANNDNGQLVNVSMPLLISKEDA